MCHLLVLRMSVCSNSDQVNLCIHDDDGEMMALSVRPLNQTFCTRTFVFYVVTKEKTMQFVTVACYFWVGPCQVQRLCHCVCNHCCQTTTHPSITPYGFACTWVKLINHIWHVILIADRNYPHSGEFLSDAEQVWGALINIKLSYFVIFIIVLWGIGRIDASHTASLTQSSTSPSRGRPCFNWRGSDDRVTAG
jgi:hypothetical protein